LAQRFRIDGETFMKKSPCKLLTFSK